ncbi:hypothetical protein WP5S18E09_03980 [Escherichia coli]|nr:hypothetical protein WP5S18E09_03980 [Escherichia coli]
MKGLNKITCCLLAALLMPCAGHAENEQYGANFNNADIRQFVEIVGQHLGKTILIDPSVQGTISVRSNDTFSQQEYYQFFLPRFYVSTSKSIIKALINMHSFEIQLSPIG